MFEDEIVIENVEENNTEIREKWLIEIINDKPRSYIDMKYVNPNITYFENSIEVDGDFYEEDDYRVIVDIDGEYILRHDSIMVEGDYYHTDDSRITINELGETILIQE